LKQFIQDCEVNEFYDASECTKTCGKGSKVQRRDVTTERMGGSKCPALTQKMSCNEQQCPIDCVQGTWSGWSACSGACGGGTRTRNRETLTPGNFGGTSCDAGEETQDCNMQACDVPCILGDWTEWSVCSKYCDSGAQSRFASITVKRVGNGHCPSRRAIERFQSQSCNVETCPSTFNCSHQVDIMFVLDSSGSVAQFGWQQTLAMTRNLSQRFTNNTTHFGAISFGAKAVLLSDFTNNSDAFLNAVKNAPWQMEGTAMDAGFTMAVEYFKSSDKFTKKVAVLVTDGRPNNDRLTRATARKLKRQRVQLVFVVVGADRSLRKRVRKLVSPPVDQNVILLENFNELPSDLIIQEVVKTACSPNYLG